MRKLSNFLAGFLMEDAILSDDDIKNDMQEQIAEQIATGIERYKGHLKTDTPRTTGWIVREKELITALERMESLTHTEIITETQAIKNNRPCTHCGRAMGERDGEPLCNHCKPKEKSNEKPK